MRVCALRHTDEIKSLSREILFVSQALIISNFIANDERKRKKKERK